MIDTIKKRRDFLGVRSGARFHGRAFVLQGKPRNPHDHPTIPIETVRFGYTATKKVGNAVARNRIKRRLRAAVAKIPSYLLTDSAGLDVVIIARQQALDAPFSQIEQDLAKGLAQLVAKARSNGQ